MRPERGAPHGAHEPCLLLLASEADDLLVSPLMVFRTRTVRGLRAEVCKHTGVAGTEDSLMCFGSLISQNRFSTETISDSLYQSFHYACRLLLANVVQYPRTQPTILEARSSMLTEADTLRGTKGSMSHDVGPLLGASCAAMQPGRPLALATPESQGRFLLRRRDVTRLGAKTTNHRHTRRRSRVGNDGPWRRCDKTSP